ncbi:MAG TPA: arginine deiminase-related protein [Anaerolineales bacterium]|nr:arginine deiminase-related protein [Anaerolineales bacterium]HNC09734.1 arginine deiminase-related protein [Anaerolineales bacterium]
MNYQHVQAPTAGVMIRPHHFNSNPETAADNAFQFIPSDLAPEVIAAQARDEFDHAVEKLRHEGIRIHVFEDYGEHETPDSVFPNNWFSTHHGGRVALFPMYSPSRRRERRHDVIEMLKSDYRVQEVVDYSGLEYDNLFLEGTGAMVFDHLERLAYVSKSNRADPVILERFCTTFGYEPMAFDTSDNNGKPIYHTNVIMSIATEYALICLDVIANPERRREIAERLNASGRTVIDLSREQVNEFAGNALEMTGTKHRVLAISERAAKALTKDQIKIIEKSAKLLPLHIPTIELAGGSVRCMIAGIHLTGR